MPNTFQCLLLVCPVAATGFPGIFAQEKALPGPAPQVLRVTSEGPLGPTALRVDLVILGDGYVAADFAPKGKWPIDSARLIRNFTLDALQQKGDVQGSREYLSILEASFRGTQWAKEIKDRSRDTSKKSRTP